MSQQTGLRARCGRLSVTEDVDNRPKLLVMTAVGTGSHSKTSESKTNEESQDIRWGPRQVWKAKTSAGEGQDYGQI